MTCLIIEDEPLAADVLKDYIRHIPFLSLKGVCPDALEALGILRRDPVDLLFLDIHLPGLKGLDFLRSLKNPPAVILTTAYHEYALQGYELSVVDYLLKPIEFKRFVEAVNKVKQQLSGVRRTISVHSDKKVVVIPADEILFMESQKEYVRIHTTSKSIMTKYALSKMEEELDPSAFLRVHRSFIVAVGKVTAYTAAEVQLPGKVIPVGRNYREQTIRRLKVLLR